MDTYSHRLFDYGVDGLLIDKYFTGVVARTREAITNSAARRSTKNTAAGRFRNATTPASREATQPLRHRTHAPASPPAPIVQWRPMTLAKHAATKEPKPPARRSRDPSCSSRSGGHSPGRASTLTGGPPLGLSPSISCPAAGLRGRLLSHALLESSPINMKRVLVTRFREWYDVGPAAARGKAAAPDPITDYRFVALSQLRVGAGRAAVTSWLLREARGAGYR